ncbi:hypothetical protein evm_010305 [Chilo suppressalis]|nr:hypothetical protein evm_010305 [Chilo suppressalis]
MGGFIAKSDLFQTNFGWTGLEGCGRDGGVNFNSINVSTAGVQAFPMDGVRRLGHDPPRGPSMYWRVLTTADAARTNSLTCLPKHRGTRDSRLLVTHPMTDHCENLNESYIFVPFGVDTVGPWGPSARFLLKELSKGLTEAAVLPTKSVNEQENDIPVPNLTSLIAEDPFAFKLGWEPVKSDAADPILGYKVKIWEQPKRKVYKYETVDGIKELVEEYAPAKFPMTSDAPDFEPKEVVIVKADKHEAKGKNMNQGVIYEFRVQAFTKNGDGPLSAPMRLQFQKPKNDDHKRDMYTMA